MDCYEVETVDQCVARVVQEAVEPWQMGFVAQSTKLAAANGRTIDAIEIVENCEAMVNEIRQPDRFLGIF